jgi:hypothetical protein
MTVRNDSGVAHNLWLEQWHGRDAYWQAMPFNETAALHKKSMQLASKLANSLQPAQVLAMARLSHRVAAHNHTHGGHTRRHAH